MKPIVTLEYFRVQNHWTWKAQIENDKSIKATGDLYPGTQKGLKAAKRDACAAISHLRDKGNIKVKRSGNNPGKT